MGGAGRRKKRPPPPHLFWGCLQHDVPYFVDLGTSCSGQVFRSRESEGPQNYACKPARVYVDSPPQKPREACREFYRLRILVGARCLDRWLGSRENNMLR